MRSGTELPSAHSFAFIVRPVYMLPVSSFSANGIFQRSAEQLVTPSCEPTLPKSCSRYTNVIMRQKYSRSNGGMAANGPVTASICGRR